MKRIIYCSLISIVVIGMSGCATIVEGTDQTMYFTISPEEAVCTLSQKGHSIATIGNGGGQITVPKSKGDIAVDCTAEGYQRQRVSLESSASGWGVVGCIFIDLCITDYATGALNKYQDSVMITLPKKKHGDSINSSETQDKQDRTTGSRDSLSRLEELKDLLDKGLITEEEAAAKRAKLLEDM